MQMYSLINQHSEQLVNSLDRTNHVQKYCYLLTHLLQVNVAEDAEFQRKYRVFWAMNVARLSESFIRAYFAYLEEHKRDQDPSLCAAATYLYSVPTGKNRRQSLQFSFASKLVHMIAPTRPVYDRMVERFYFLPNGTATGLDRLETLMASYNFLTREYRRIINADLLHDAIDACRGRFPTANLTTEKLIDSLIWSYVSWLQDGAVRDGHVDYA